LNGTALRSMSCKVKWRSWQHKMLFEA
jgi:hypothetical protein